MAGKLTCSNHLDREARFSCTVCQTLLCDDCALRKWIRERPIDQCRSCQALLVALDARQTARAHGQLDGDASGFLAQVPAYARLTFDTSVLFLIGGLLLITGPLYWAIPNNLSSGLGIFGTCLVKGLEMSVYLGILSQTADGKDEISPPDVTDLADDVFGPLWRYLAAILPILVGIAWFGAEIGSYTLALAAFSWDPRVILDHPGPAAVVAIGLGLLPLLTIIAAYSQSVIAVLNPKVWSDTIGVLGASYVAASMVFYAIMAIELWVMIPIYLWMKLHLDIPVVTSALILFSAYLLMALRARILGGLVRPHLAQLG